ncbi:uncharacterized protein YecE (DUF72 family) [Oikeobacillus pervagus]|uniref:Uncharacterized protein YecE (DUF72 family) n=1 Tax=Oikeobacillus pervagus TaxID=1325931 RepID=A0AAJ1T3B9_9BACI|nr:DUF72 domain-containing protein [Oikeobacillus pervagus]MDQ0215154.1 uncharacterized protein YecE (DUF72 family) [Oikeobacillus pervagus]
MIYIGVTGWGDHDSLYHAGISSRDKLKLYAGYFPIVEVDTSFYAIQPRKNAEKWVRETPRSFQFIVKAYQGMTGHSRGENPFDSKQQMFDAFKESLEPYVNENKLAMVLFQFPPWFDCQKKHVNYLRYCKESMRGFPLAIEFRHQSWYSEDFKEKTLEFIKKEGWIHTICDEPQVGNGSVPIVLEATHSEKTLFRFHGRNVYGWRKPKQENWREVRYLYRYNEQELKNWTRKIHALASESRDIYVLFNNNSGGDAADNAKQMIELLGIEYTILAPRQLDLF